MGEIARHDHGAGERQPRLHRIFGELRQDLLHRLAQVDLDHRAAELFLVDLRQVLRRMMLELSVVTKDVPPGALVVGNPARVLRMLNPDEL